MKKSIRKSLYLGVVTILFSVIISCEKDFTDIASGVVSNTKFETNKDSIYVKIENSPIDKIVSDNITREPGQYLLGVFNKPDYEKIEASIITQIGIASELKLTDKTFGADTTVVSTIDTVFLKLPYQATLESNTNAPKFILDSIIGDQSKNFTLNLYQTDTYLSRLDPNDPSKTNKYFSDAVFQKTGSELNSDLNYQFKPNENDTLIVIKRRLSNTNLYATDTVKYLTTTVSGVPIPFARIPIKEDVFKQLFLDKYQSNEFSSQDAFNNYFRGLIIEATGNEGSLISFDFNSTNLNLAPSIEVYYTNTVLKSGSIVLDTIKKSNRFSLSGIRANTFKMQDRVYPVNDQVILQGAAGSEAKINLFGPDNDGNGIADKIDNLRSQNLLITNASLSFYINQSADTTAVPYGLYMYKSDETGGSAPIVSQIKDVYSEGRASFGGFLERKQNGKVEKYTFNITDYISDILSGETDYSPTLKLKVRNISDYPITDTTFTNYSWNPKAVTIFNNLATNEGRKAKLRISYSKKKN